MPGEHPAALVVESTDGQLPSTVLLHHVAVGGALELARLTEAQERERRLGANLLTRLLDRRIDPQAAQLQLAELGLDLAECVLIAALAAGDGTPVHRRLAAARVPHALLHRDRAVYLLLPATAAATALAAETWPSPADGPAGLGVSDRIAVPSRVADAVQEARWALAVATASGQRTVHYGDESMTLPPRTPAEARVLVIPHPGPADQARCPAWHRLRRYAAGLPPSRPVVAGRRGGTARTPADARLPIAEDRAAHRPGDQSHRPHRPVVAGIARP